MRKLIVLILAGLMLMPSAYGQRKKVGVVLCGGGAKGFAHIGALKVLEEAGIPIDYIGGTSMGAIIGGLYSIGYNADALDSIIQIQDWPHLLSDNVYRSNLPESAKENTSYIASINYKKQGIKLPSGVVSGQNILNLFLDMTTGYHAEMDFRKLPIPFSCVAADMKSGKEIVLNHGSLPVAMRASMAIPGFFSPVRLDTMLLIDGGILNNYPVDVVRKMGADIIIGITFTSDEKKSEKNQGSLLELADNMKNFMGKELYDKNIKNTDIAIQVNLGSYNVASFEKEAIDSIVTKGEKATRDKWPELVKLKESLGLAADYKPLLVENQYIRQDTLAIRRVKLEGLSSNDEAKALKEINIGNKITRKQLQNIIGRLYGTDLFSKVYYRLENESPYDLIFEVEKKDIRNLNIGIRFDSEDMAAILLSTNIRLNTSLSSTFGVTARLSKNPYLSVDYSFGLTSLYKGGFTYKVEKNEINIYNKGIQAYNLSFVKNSLDFNLGKFYFYNMMLNLGVNFDYFEFQSQLKSAGQQTLKLESKPYINYFLTGTYDNLDKSNFPDKGQYFAFKYMIQTDNFFEMERHNPIQTAYATFFKPIAVSDKVTFTPTFTGRVILNDSVPVIYSNFAGGQWDNHYLSQQISLEGMRGMELLKNSFLKTQLDLRYKFYKRNSLHLGFNFSLHSDKLFKLLEGNQIIGGVLGYSYNTIIGPIKFQLGYSNLTKKVYPFLCFGYHF